MGTPKKVHLIFGNSHIPLFKGYREGPGSELSMKPCSATSANACAGYVAPIGGNSLKGVIRGVYREVFEGFFRRILGV